MPPQESFRCFTEGKRLHSLPASPLAFALRALCLVDQHFMSGCTLQIALNQVLATSHEQLLAKDRHLTSELAYGSVRLEKRLAYILSTLLREPLKLPLPLRRLLALATYALIALERMPAHAIIHNAVELSKALYPPHLAKLTNATLRSVQRLGQEVDQLEFYTGQADEDCFFAVDMKQAKEIRRYNVSLKKELCALARLYALPNWLIALWHTSYGMEHCHALLCRSAARPWQGLRVNAIKDIAPTLYQELLVSGAEQSLAQSVGTWGVAFAPGQTPTTVYEHSLEHWLKNGSISQQAAGSQEVLKQLGLDDWRKEGWPIWDACAGYGGKSVQLLEQEANVLLCTDNSFSRLRLLPEHCQRLGLPCPQLAQADASQAPILSWQGGIIADVPCSGLGVLARRPDIRRRPQSALAAHVALQKNILHSLTNKLCVGAELVYITCTLNPAENEIQIGKLLAERSDLLCLCQWQTPHTHPWLEGMFAARLRRIG